MTQIKTFKSDYTYGRQPSDYRNDVNKQINDFAKENNLDIKSVFYETLEEYSSHRLFGTAIFSSSERSEKDQELIEKLTRRIEALENNLDTLKFELSKPKITDAPAPEVPVSGSETLEVEFGNYF